MSIHDLDGVEDDDPQPGSAGRSGPSIWLILFALVAFITTVFIVQNGEETPAEFLWFDRDIKLWVAIVASIALGILLDRLILTWWRRSRKRKDD
jgi:uncharacterized integral membrane protein